MTQYTGPKGAILTILQIWKKESENVRNIIFFWIFLKKCENGFLLRSLANELKFNQCFDIKPISWISLFSSASFFWKKWICFPECP